MTSEQYATVKRLETECWERDGGCYDFDSFPKMRRLMPSQAREYVIVLANGVVEAILPGGAGNYDPGTGGILTGR